MRSAQLTGVVFFSMLVFVCTQSHANEEPFSGVYRHGFDVNRIMRISQLGEVPGFDYAELLLEDVDQIHFEARQTTPSVEEIPAMTILLGLYSALRTYQSEIQRFSGLTTYQPEQLIVIRKASVAARVQILNAIEQGLKEPIPNRGVYYSSVRALFETQKVYFGKATLSQVKFMKEELSRWPSVFEHILKSATPDMQLLIVKYVIEKDFIPPFHVFALEARQIVGNLLKTRNLNPEVVDRLRDQSMGLIPISNAHVASYSTLQEIMNRKFEIDLASPEERAIWDMETIKSVPAGVAEYLDTDINSIEDLVKAHKKLQLPKARQKSETASAEMNRQLNIYHFDMYDKLTNAYVCIVALLQGIILGLPDQRLAQFESWYSIINALVFHYETNNLHPVYSQFALKVLADFIEVARDHFPMSPSESIGLVGLLIHGSHYKQDHPHVRRIAQAAVRSDDFSLKVKLAAINYLIVHSDRRERSALETHRYEILEQFPPIIAEPGSFPGAPVYWSVNRKFPFDTVIEQPLLEAWLWQQGCEALLF